MINHQHKFIFIHIPKCAGSSIRDFYFNAPKLDWKTPNYDLLYGWCPKRKLHLQHATSQQLLETELISEEVFKTYFKFTFVRNPYDRSYSDYLWVQRDRKITGSFKDYIFAKGSFDYILNNQENKEYRGDHVLPQTDFFYTEGEYKINFLGRFENLQDDLKLLNKELEFRKPFTQHSKKNKKRFSHYSFFYTGTKKRWVEEKYHKDLSLLNYHFEDYKKGFQKIKNYI